MSKIKYISFSKKDAVFDSERIVGELLDVCEQINLGEDGIMCRMQVVQGELVHCKDCKDWRPYINSEYNEGDCYGTDLCMTGDDFCSQGELK